MPASSGDGEALPRVGRVWRLAAVTVVALLLAYGTVRGTDDLFPFGPFVMYAFSVPSDGEIRSTWVEADLATGRRVQVPLSPAGVGLRRAEIEGQLPRIVRQPSRLQALAVAHHRLHPREPGYSRLYVLTRVTRLHQGVAAGSSVKVTSQWTVR